MCRQMNNAESKQVVAGKRWQTDSGRWLRIGASVFPAAAVAGVLLAASVPAFASIDNVATASGNYGDQVVQTDAARLELSVEPPKAALAVTQTAVLDVSGGEDTENVDGGDTLTLTVTVTNTGNVAMRDVRPTAVALTAEGVGGTGGFAATKPERIAEIAPGKSHEFIVVYRLSAEDVYRAAGKEDGLVVKAAATGTGPTGEVTARAEDAQLAVAANPALSIAKAAHIRKADGNRGADLETGDVITYTYTVTNTGNVPINGIVIVDEHEGVLLNSADVTSAEKGPFDETEIGADPLGISSDESGTNGVWDVLGAGGAVTFTYRHTVTQAEFEAQ